MKRRQFLKTAGTAGAIFPISALAGCSTQNYFLTMHSFSDYEATIAIKGLEKTTTMLHITDSHISVVDEKEIEFHTYSRRMDNAYSSVPHYKTEKETTPVASFLELMETAKNSNVDVIVLTGDIINNPSKSSIRFILESVQQTGIPSIYVAGNHDWHYEGMEGPASTLRQTWIDNSLLPLYSNNNPLYASNIIGGINFVTIDNSTYQVNDEQLVFYQKQAKQKWPIVLLMHIPIFHPKDADKDSVSTIGDPRWGWDIDKNYEVERRERWSKNGNLPSTVAFVECVKNSNNLAAILAGHTHRPRADTISETAVQYVAGKAADGQHRLVTLKPLG